MKKNSTKRKPAKKRDVRPNAKRRYSKINRKHKDRLFRLIFSNRKYLLQLYNAIRDSHYENPDDLIITTCDDVIYMGMKNDVSFLIDDVLNLYEHQASFNPNMGLRGFLYLADSYRKFVESNKMNLYSSTPLKLPMPQYLVFYNGTKEEPDRMEIKLSDLFQKTDDLQPCVEVTATMLNINRGHNQELMERCQILWEYSEFIGRIRMEQQAGNDLQDSVNAAVESCIQDNILAEFLISHRAEVMEVVLTEYDEAGHIAYEKKISREEGEVRKLTQLICKKLVRGKSVDQIAEELEEDFDTVSRICEIAAAFAPDYDCDNIVKEVIKIK